MYLFITIKSNRFMQKIAFRVLNREIISGESNDIDMQAEMSRGEERQTERKREGGCLNSS